MPGSFRPQHPRLLLPVSICLESIGHSGSQRQGEAQDWSKTGVQDHTVTTAPSLLHQGRKQQEGTSQEEKEGEEEGARALRANTPHL